MATFGRKMLTLLTAALIWSILIGLLAYLFRGSQTGVFIVLLLGTTLGAALGVGAVLLTPETPNGK